MAQTQIITTLRRQTTKALTALQQEITKREKELETLKAEAGRWESVSGKQVKVEKVSASPRGTRRQAKSARRAKKVQRLDWNTILGQLPKTFTVKDVAQNTGKSMNSVYAVSWRWMKAKKVRKSKDGYEKV